MITPLSKRYLVVQIHCQGMETCYCTSLIKSQLRTQVTSTKTLIVLTEQMYVYFYFNTTMKETRQHTLTGDSSIFKVRTVVNTKCVTGTVHKSELSPSTAHLIQKNSSSSLAKEGTGPGNSTCGDKFTFKVREKSYLENYYCICRIIAVTML